PALEAPPQEGWYHFSARYTHGAAEFRVPANLDQSTADRCLEAAHAAHLALGCRHLPRTAALPPPRPSHRPPPPLTPPGRLRTAPRRPARPRKAPPWQAFFGGLPGSPRRPPPLAPPGETSGTSRGDLTGPCPRADSSPEATSQRASFAGVP